MKSKSNNSKSNNSYKSDTKKSLSLNDIQDVIDGNDYYKQIQKEIKNLELLLNKGLNKTKQNQFEKEGWGATKSEEFDLNKVKVNQSQLVKKKNETNTSEEFEYKEESNKTENSNDKFIEEDIIKNLKNQLNEFNEKKLNECLDNVDVIFPKIKKNFDNYIFEEKCIDLLKTKYNLKEYDAFPYFKKIKSKKGHFIYQINYYFINVEVENTHKKFFIFEEVGDYYPIIFNNNKVSFFALIKIDSNNNKIRNINYYFKKGEHYNYLIESELVNDDNRFKSTLKEGQIDEKYLNIEKIIKEIQCEILNLSEGDGKNKNKDEINKKNEIIQNLKKKQEEILQKKEKKIIEINIYKIERELDGFFQTNEKITIKNDVFDLEIEKESFIIVEVKNNKKYQEIMKNMAFKKQILIKLGVPLKKFYFIGILYEIDKNDLNTNQDRPKENKIIIITIKDLLKNKEKIYENNTQSNVNTLEQKINNIENRMGKLESRMNGVENRMDKLESRMNGVENRMDKLENRMGKLEGRMDELENKMEKRFSIIDTTLNMILSIVKKN